MATTKIKSSNIDSTANVAVTTANVSSGVNIGANVNLSTTGINVGNSTVNAVHTATQITVANSTNTATLTPLTLTIGGLVANSLVVNSASFTTTGITANVTGVYPTSNTSGQNLGTTTQRYVTYANTVDTSGLITGGAGLTITGTANASVAMNVGANVNLSATQIAVGNSTVNTTITSSSISTNGTLTTTGLITGGAGLTITGTANASTGVNVGANVNLSTTQLNVGNATINTVVTQTTASFNANSLYVAANSNIGIGVTAPAYKLDVRGRGYFSTTALQLTLGDSGNATISAIGTSNQNLIFYPDGSNEKVRIDSLGNMGVGITPTTTWTSTTKVIELGTSGSQGALWLLNNGSTYLSFNTYYNGTNFIYKNTSYATLYGTGSSGTHFWQVAASGTAGANVAFTTAMTIDNSGNLGLGVIPSAWALSGQKIFQVLNGSLTAYTTDEATVTGNAYHNGSGWRYIATNFAQQYSQQGGKHMWFNAPSGTAGNAITFTQAMTLTAAGELLIGSTSALQSSSGRGVIQVNGTSQSIFTMAVGGAIKGYLYNNGTDQTVTSAAGALIFEVPTERMRITSAGNFLIGTTTSYSRLTVSNGSSTRSIITISDGDTASLMFGAGNSLPATIGTDAASGIRFLTGSGAGNESGTELMRYNSTGLGVGVSPTYRLDVSVPGNEVISRFAQSDSDHGLVLIKDSTSTTSPYLGSYGNAMAFGRYGGGETMRLTSAGYVGIGTTSPATKLSATATRQGNADGLSSNLNAIQWEISGQGYTSIVSNLASSENYNAGLLVKLGSTGVTDKILDLESGGVNRVRVLGNGYVGIGTGTGSPRTLLDFRQQNNNQIITLGENGNPLVRSGFGLDTSNAAIRYYSVDGHYFGKVSASDGSTWSEWMRITPAGRLGIGTTAPNYLLSVYGPSGDLFNLQTSSGMGTAGEAIGINFTQSTNVQVAGIQALTTSNSNIALTFGTYSSGYSEKMRITSTGYVGMGNASPNYKLDVGTGEGSQSATRGSLGCYRNATGADSSPYTQARLIIYGGTGIDPGNYGYFAYGADASFRFVYAKTGSGTNPLLFGTTSAMDGTGSFTETLRLDTSGNLKLSASGSKVVNSSGNPILQQTGSVVQTQYLSSATRVATTHTGWAEPSTAYRISITPTSTGSMIILRFFVACQVNSAQNVLQLFRAFRTVGGGANNYALTSAGTTNGSRHVIAGHSNRPWNGYDSNDVMNWMVEVIDFPGTTSTCTYGFETNPEGGNTTYFGYTNTNSGTWGFDTDIVIVAQEIAQ